MLTRFLTSDSEELTRVYTRHTAHCKERLAVLGALMGEDFYRIDRRCISFYRCLLCKATVLRISWQAEVASRASEASVHPH